MEERQTQKRKRVVVLHTGGTIFMRKTERGRDVTENLVIPKDKDNNISNHIDFEVVDLFGKGGKDSSRLTMENSKTLAERIVECRWTVPCLAHELKPKCR